MPSRHSILNALLTGFLLTLAAAGAFALLTLVVQAWNDAHAQEPPYAQPRVTAFCLDENDLGRVIAAQETKGNAAYLALMLDPESSCTDIRITGGRPIPVALIEILQKRVIDGDCVVFWRVGDVSGQTALTWLIDPGACGEPL